MKFLSQSTIKGQTVILRVDYNEEIGTLVPFRILKSLRTINKLREGGNKIIILASYGRPNGDKDKEHSMREHARLLAMSLKLPIYEAKPSPSGASPCVLFVTDDLRKNETLQAIKTVDKGVIVFCENIRFIPEEESSDVFTAQRIASIADIYVNEAFANSHRESLSMTVLPTLLPSYAGYNLEEEVKSLSKVLTSKDRPFIGIFGGLKLSGKIDCVTALMPRMDKVLLGGGIANIVLKSKGYEIGHSVFESDSLDKARHLWLNYKEKIVLPIDVLINTIEDKKPKVKKIIEIKPEDQISDIGPETIKLYSKLIKQSRLLVWNGPLGYYEEKMFSHGSSCIALAISSVATSSCFAVCGGGETDMIIEQAGLLSSMDLVSTGGGAMLEFLAGHKLPAIEALKYSHSRNGRP